MARRFLPTVDLWNHATQEAIRCGQIRLQTGQWVQCGPGPKARFVCVRPSGTLWVVHAEGRQPKVSIGRFVQCVKSWKGR